MNLSENSVYLFHLFVHAYSYPSVVNNLEQPVETQFFMIMHARFSAVTGTSKELLSYSN